jgi:hypothetical protein
MSYFIPDPRWEMPELLFPGRKPSGEVEINWDDPINKDLRAYYMGDGIGRSMRDLVSPDYPANFLSASEYHILAGRPHVVQSSGSTQVAASNANTRLDLVNGMTLLGWIRLVGTNTYPSLVYKNHNTSYCLCADWGGTGPQTTFHHGGARDDHNWGLSTPNFNQWYFIATTYDQVTVRGWLDGVEASLADATANPGVIGTDSDDVDLGGSVTGNQGGEMYVDNIRIYERALAEAEIHKIRLDGFTGLIPK